MAALILFEDQGVHDLGPLVRWRSVFELIVGRRIQLDRLSQALHLSVQGIWVRDWMAQVAGERCSAPANSPHAGPVFLVNGRWIPDRTAMIPTSPCIGIINDQFAYASLDADRLARLRPPDLLHSASIPPALVDLPRHPAGGRMFRYPWDLVGLIDDILRLDWSQSDAAIESPIDPQVRLAGCDCLHIGERVALHPTTVINATSGPVFVADDVQIGPFAVLEGPLYLGPGCRISPHAWLHGGNIIGPVCKIGGEVTGCIIHGYSNKQHAGFLGHAWVGSWVNIGAGASNSNLRNDYAPVRVRMENREVDTGQTFFGAILADHVKVGINTALSTGAIVDFASSLAASPDPPRYVPPFTWLAHGEMRRADPAKSLETAQRMMSRRKTQMTPHEIQLFHHIADGSKGPDS